jgi:hypothetical protein
LTIAKSRAKHSILMRTICSSCNRSKTLSTTRCEPSDSCAHKSSAGFRNALATRAPPGHARRRRGWH